MRLTVEQVRSRYLAFFRARGHAVIPSAPIVPGNDPTTLFTSSGMQPLVPYLLGAEHPEGVRLANSQMSFRAGDIEEVGDNRHTTFFEMLGNWSLGDYFKKEQLPWFFEFLTDTEHGLGLDPARLYVTVFAGDTATGMGEDLEAVGIWQELFAQKGVDNKYAVIGSEADGYEKGMQGARIFAYDAKKNWWSRAGVPANMPAGEPGGPDSEVFYDFGTPHDPAFGTECHPNCDCGRFVEIGNSVFMQFVKAEDGTFPELPKRNVDFGGGLERLAFATLGTPDAFLIDVFDGAREHLQKTSGTTYGSNMEVTRSYRIVLDHMRAATFMLAEGVTPSKNDTGYVLRRLLRRTVMASRAIGSGERVLPEISATFARAYQSTYPHLSENLVKIQSEIVKETEQFGLTLASAIQKLWKIFYDNERSERDKLNVDTLYYFFTTEGFPPDLTLDQYRAYRLERGESVLSLEDTENLMKAFSVRMKEHQDQSRAGAAQKFAGGLADHAEQTVRYHTTHHILLKALQTVLGGEVKQRGSNITSERLRIDFASPGKMTDEQKAEVERIVNEVIYQDLPVTRTTMPRSEAETLGAEMEFGVKYPDTVTVYSVGPLGATTENPRIAEAFSLEFCGGPHVANTAEIHEGGKRFKIQKEEAVAAGVRRIKGVLA